MKSVLQALWLLTVTFGNIIVVIIAEIKMFDSQASEFFLFTVLMGIDILLFIYLAIRYTYRTEDETEPENSASDTATVEPNTPYSFTANTVGDRSSSRSTDKEKLDASPKCLKQRAPADKSGVDNYGYADI